MLSLSFTENASLETLSFDGVEFANPLNPRLFTLQLRDFVGNPLRFSQSDFKNAQECQNQTYVNK